MVLWFLCPGAPEGSSAVFLILKRLRRRGQSLKSHRTDWEKLAIEPATPGLQNIGLSPTPRRLHVRKCYQQMTKVIASKERVRYGRQM